MQATVAVVGAGSWGTTLAALAADAGHTARIWCRRAEIAAEISAEHRSPYLPGISLPWALRASTDASEVLAGADYVLVAVPSHALGDVIGAMAGEIGADATVLSVSKGIEQQTLRRMTEVLAAELPQVAAARIGALSGPNLAREIAQHLPAATVVAMHDSAAAAAAQATFMTPNLRVYTNTDVLGVELCGAAKNTVAIAAGIVDGLGFGDNASAALITRGLAEVTRLGMRLGGDPLTFAGLAGAGDLIATCTSLQSRNRHVGEELAKGRKVGEIVDDLAMVAEGVNSTRALCDLAAGAGVEMPIADQVARVLYDGVNATEAVQQLMGRAPRPEVY
ncbi:MAG: NAD(P)H-dependent glycerol-3-phosphate dehydrogenase [Acidimicrobiia bacterium]